MVYNEGMDYVKGFAQTLKKLMEESGLTTRALAGRLGISATSVSQWLRAASVPRLDMLCLLADHFDLSLDELVGRRDY